VRPRRATAGDPAERGARPWADDPVGSEMQRALEASHRVGRPRAEAPVGAGAAHAVSVTPQLALQRTDTHGWVVGHANALGQHPRRVVLGGGRLRRHDEQEQHRGDQRGQ